MTARILPVIFTAFTTRDAIERMHDQTSAVFAQRSLGEYARLLLETGPEDQERVAQILDDQEGPVPTLTDLHQRYLAAWANLYTRIHATKALAA